MSGAGRGIRRLVVAGTAVVLAGLGLAAPASAATAAGYNAFVTDSRQNQVYVIDTATNAITATVPRYGGVETGQRVAALHRRVRAKGQHGASLLQ